MDEKIIRMIKNWHINCQTDTAFSAFTTIKNLFQVSFCNWNVNRYSKSYCLCHLYGSTEFGSMSRHFFENYRKWSYGCYGCYEPRADIYFKLGEYQTVKGMVPILVW